MNEHIGFLCCPGCDMPWGSGQWACPYCHGTEKPAALRVHGPTWAWLLVFAALMFGLAADLYFGGHVIALYRNWSIAD